MEARALLSNSKAQEGPQTTPPRREERREGGSSCGFSQPQPSPTCSRPEMWKNTEPRESEPVEEDHVVKSSLLTSPAASASITHPQGYLEMQALRSPRPIHQNLHFNEPLRRCSCTLQFESFGLGYVYIPRTKHL